MPDSVDDRADIYEHTLEIANKIEDYDIKDGLNLLPVQYKNPDKDYRGSWTKATCQARL